VKRRLILLGILALCAAALLFVPLPIPPTVAGRQIENAGHMPLFMLLTFVLIVILRRDFGLEGWRLYGTAGAVGVFAGLLSEVIQRPLRRDASWEDVLADALGVVCALALHALFARGSSMPRKARVAAFAIAAACIVVYSAPLVRMTRAYLHRNAQFPVLADFRSNLEMFWVVGYGVNRAQVGDALEVEFREEQFPGVSLHEPVADWSKFRTLIIDVGNPDPVRLRLTVRVHDKHHNKQFADRFNRSFELSGGERREIRIPLDDIQRGPRNRLMDLRHMSDITLFRGDNEGSRRLRVYSLRLE
jgi:VanZ family protein